MKIPLYFVYIMTNASRTLYIGITNDLNRRVLQHRSKSIPGFTRRYNITRLAYYEPYRQVTQALAREKQLKGWRRSKKIALIETMNPEWSDLCASGSASFRTEPSPRGMACRPEQGDRRAERLVIPSEARDLSPSSEEIPRRSAPRNDSRRTH